MQPSSTQNTVSQQADIAAQINTLSTGNAVSHTGISSSTSSFLRNFFIGVVTAHAIILKIVL